jgi:hypothetical protein
MHDPPFLALPEFDFVSIGARGAGDTVGATCNSKKMMWQQRLNA